MKFKYDQTDMYLYYQESRTLPNDTLRAWMEVILKHIPRHAVNTIIDLGCGTGRFCKALSENYEAMVYAVDPSGKMLSVARQSTQSKSVEFLRGSAENIPLRVRSVDMIFLSMVYHHIVDKNKALGEIKRVLKTNGRICVRTSTKEDMHTFPWLGFFPGAGRIENEVIPSRADITGVFLEHGLPLTAHDVISQITAASYIEFYEKLSLRGISSLKSIPDNEFQEGLIRFKEFCQSQNPDDSVTEDIELFVFSKT